MDGVEGYVEIVDTMKDGGSLPRTDLLGHTEPDGYEGARHTVKSEDVPFRKCTDSGLGSASRGTTTGQYFGRATVLEYLRRQQCKPRTNHLFA